MMRRLLTALLLATLILPALAPPAASQSIADIVAKAKPAVAFIRVPGRGEGSGFVVHRQGFVVTNFHVVQGGARIVVTLPGDSPTEARLLAFDRDLDVAVLKVNRSDLPILTLGDSGTLRQGEEILVIGWPLGSDLGTAEASVTRGIVSNLNSLRGWVQIDAAVNHGNSGGPVLNLKGEVVGIVVAGLTGVVPGAEGLNFAIPINRAKPIIAAQIGPPLAIPVPPPPPPTPQPTPSAPPAGPQPPIPTVPPSGGERKIFGAQENLDRVSWVNDTTILVTGGLPTILEIKLISIVTGEVKSVGRGGCSSLSPDRSRAAWVSGAGPPSGDAWVLDLRSMQARRLTQGPRVSCLAWSPDGSRLALTTGGVLPDGPILIISAEDGQVQTEIQSGGFHLYDPAWSPDGGRLAFSSTRFAAPPGVGYLINQIEVFDLRLRIRSKLLDVPSRFRASNLLFSADSQALLFEALPSDGGFQIYVFDGSGLRALVAGRSPAWHPDRESITFVRGRDLYIAKYK